MGPSKVGMDVHTSITMEAVDEDNGNSNNEGDEGEDEGDSDDDTEGHNVSEVEDEVGGSDDDDEQDGTDPDEGQQQDDDQEEQVHDDSREADGEWCGFKLVGDNWDINLRPRFQSLESRTLSQHHFYSYALLDRIDFSGLSDVAPSPPQKIATSRLLPSEQDKETLLSTFEIMVSR